jgi:hypothetical protein
VSAPERRHSTSLYHLQLPISPLDIDQLVIESDTPFFDRAYRLIARHPDETETILAEGRLTLRAERPRPVTLAFRTTRASALDLAIEDGDETPLTFRAARARAVEPELFLVAPAGDYSVLLGDAAAAAPRYELERVRDVVLAVGSGEATTGALVPNPDYSVRARLAGGDRLTGALPKLLLWTVLIGAVVVLTIITLRLARR